MLDPRREPSPRFFRTFLDLTWTEGTEGRDGEDPEVMTGTQIQQAGAPNLDPGTQMIKKKPTTCLLHWPLADVRHFLPVRAEAAALAPVSSSSDLDRRRAGRPTPHPAAHTSVLGTHAARRPSASPAHASCYRRSGI